MNTMMTYIEQETQVGRRILQQRDETFHGVRDCLKRRPPIKKIVLLATGSSYNACLAAKLSMEKAELEIDIREPFQFYHYETLPASTDLVVAVSQKGTSLSTIQAVQKVKAGWQVPVIALTSVVSSPLSAEVDVVLDMNCGIETVGFSTKGVTATILTLMLLGVEVAVQKLPTFDLAGALSDLAAVVERMAQVKEASLAFYQQYKQELQLLERYTFIGYGPNLGTAKEAETKMTETIRVPAQGFELEAYLHGPIFELKREYGVFLLQWGTASAAQRSHQVAEFLTSYCDHVFCVSDQSEQHPAVKTLMIDNAGITEDLSPLLLVIPFQVLAYLISTDRGIELAEPVYIDFRQRLGSKVGEKD